MANSLNKNLSGNNVVTAISSDNFGEYTPEMQEKIICSIENYNEREGGLMGKVFGNKKENASMNIAATICILLIIICGMDIIHSVWTNGELHMDLISTIIPVVSLALGFIFGKGDGKEG